MLTGLSKTTSVGSVINLMTHLELSYHDTPAVLNWSIYCTVTLPTAIVGLKLLHAFREILPQSLKLDVSFNFLWYNSTNLA